MAPRFAAAITGVVLGGFLVMAFVYLVLDDPSPVRAVLAAAALVLMLVLQVGIIGNPRSDPSRPTAYLALVGQCAVVLLAVEFGYGWLGLLGFVGGSVLLVLRGRVRWWVFAFLCLLNPVLYIVLIASDLLLLWYVSVQTVVTGLFVYGLTRLRQTAVELDRTRRKVGDLATARERLRLARDLHGTTGHRLSGIALRAQLARRLSGSDPDRSVADVRDIVITARAALDEMRTTARHYRTPRLADEIAAARAALRSLNIVTTVRAEKPDVPTEIESVFVSVLRASMDELLAADAVKSCTVTVAADGRRVRMRIEDDRTIVARSSPDRDLVEAVSDAGGSLTCGPLTTSADLPDSGWAVIVEMPQPLPADLRPPPARPAGPVGALPFAQVLLAAVLIGYALNSVYFVLAAGPAPGIAVIGALAVAVTLALQLGVTGRHAGWVGPRKVVVVSQALLAAGSIVLIQDPYVGLPGFVAGGALIVLPRRVRWVAFAVVVASVTLAQVVLSGTPVGIAYGFFATVNHGLIVYGLTRLRDLVAALQAARDDVAALAVARERLRFARDLHDLLGYGLSAITLKSELAGRLLDHDPERARGELDGVIGLVAGALADVRAVAGHQQPLDLAAEIESVQSGLDGAGISVDLAPQPFPDLSAVPALQETVMATVLREAATNILRHSDATQCRIIFDDSDDQFRLDVINDGVHVIPQDPAGTGLGSLAARAEQVGGSFDAGPDGAGRFIVRVRLPTECADLPVNPDDDLGVSRPEVRFASTAAHE